MLGPVLFNSSVKDLDNGTEYTLSKLADGIGKTGAADDCVTIKRGLNRLKEGVNRKLMKFNREQCKVLHLQMMNVGNSTYGELTDWKASSQRTGMLLDKLNMSQQCTLVASKFLGCFRKSIASTFREVSLHLSASNSTSFVLCLILACLEKKAIGLLE